MTDAIPPVEATPEPAPIDPAAGPFLVVGVDGSPGSAAALRHGLDIAARRGWAVHVVAAYDGADVWAAVFGEHVDVRAVHHRTRRAAEEMVELGRRERAEAGEPNPPVTVTVCSGPAAVVLTRLARHAEVLVVGHRGLGGVSSRFLGSVGLNCVVHAPCTVTVVHAPEHATP